MEKEKLFEIFSEAIGVDKSKVSYDSSSDNLPEWDSLGHLTFLSALDEETDGKSAEISELTNTYNLKEIKHILEKNNI